ncbi:hypothetical protein HAX54_015067, partial [Datura stramonium]|nr:hypothetical protein [Datura stramonium]
MEYTVRPIRADFRCKLEIQKQEDDKSIKDGCYLKKIFVLSSSSQRRNELLNSD